MASNFTPQQIEQFLQEFFDVVGTRQYTGARYVPIFGRAGEDTVEWNDVAPYEPLTVVMHEGVSYVSRRYVPRGIEITDTDYWVETYRFNAQVEQYRMEVLSFQGQIDQLGTDLIEGLGDLRSDVADNYVPFPYPPTYPKYGSPGQVLSTLGNGETTWVEPVTPSDEQAEEIITQWLDDHPEATTTVLDGAVTNPKLATEAVTDAKMLWSGNLLGNAQESIIANSHILGDADVVPYLYPEQGGYDIETGAKRSSQTQLRYGEVLEFPIGTILTFSHDSTANMLVFVTKYDLKGNYVGYDEHLGVVRDGFTYVTETEKTGFMFYSGSGSPYTTPEQIGQHTHLKVFSQITYYNQIAHQPTYENDAPYRMVISRDVEFEAGGYETSVVGKRPVKRVSSTQVRMKTDLRLPIGSMIFASGVTASQVMIVIEMDSDGLARKETSVAANVNGFVVGKQYMVTEYPNVVIYMTTSNQQYDISDIDGTLLHLVALKNNLQTKRFSILGDSISTFTGVTAANVSYYPQGDVQSPKQTWWGVFADHTGMILDTDNSISSSAVCYNATYTGMSEDSRLENLGTPDVVLFAGGTNDIYSGKNSTEWAGDDVETLSTQVFTQAYTKVIKYVQENYGATVVGITPNFIKWNDTGRINCTIERTQDIDSNIGLLCDYLGALFFDTRKLGMTLSNIDDYTVDGLHWDLPFTTLMGRKLAEFMVGQS